MTVLEAYLDPLARCFTPEVARRVADFRPDADTEARSAYLREQANEGRLTDVERNEYLEFVEAVDFIGLLKLRARKLLNP